MSDEEKKTRATTGVKFSAFKQVGPQDGNPVEVVGLRDGENVRAPLTTDLIETNPGITFRNAKGQFTSVDPGVTELTNQLKVNRYLYDRMLERGVTIDVAPPDIYAEGTFWFDNTADTMQLFLWHEESGAWLPVAPPTTLEGRVEAGETTQAAIIAQIQESLEDQADLADRIAAGETEQSTLKNKVNALEGVIGEYSLVFTMDNSNPRAGEFNLKDGAMQVTNTLASADYITLSDTDRNGNAINLDRITEGDVLRFSSVDGQAAEIKITDGTNGFFSFTKVSGELDRLSDMPYQFILLSSFDPAGLATIDYVDAQDATKMSKSGEQMLTEGAWRIKQPKSGGGNATFININDNEMHLYHVASPESPTHAANMQYVDDQIAAIPEADLSGYLPLTGGTLTGEFSMKRTDDASWWNYIRSEKPNAWDGSDSSKQQVHGLIIDIGTTNTYKQQFKISGRSSKDLLVLSDDGKAQAEIFGALKANEMFKDGKAVATEEYVDSHTGGERPMLWKYNPNVSANNLGNGEFNLSSSPTNGGASEWSIYFAKRDANGQYWYPHDNGNAYSHSIGEQLATIRGREQVSVHGKTKQWLFNQGSNKYAQLKLTYYRSSNPLGTGKYHLITIPGYMPYFTFSTDAQSNGTHS